MRSQLSWLVALTVGLIGTSAVSEAPVQAAATPIKATSAQDFSGDGKADIVAPTRDGALWLYRGNGSGGFTGTRTKIGAGWSSLDQIRLVGNWDGVAGTDLIARVPATGALRLYSGNGKGGFGKIRAIGAGWQVFTQIFSPGDWDGDGHNDLLAIVRSTGHLRMYRGNGAGGFLGSKVIGGGWTRLDGLTMTGDFDGDGLPDFLARNTVGQLLLYRGNGSGGFNATRIVGTGWSQFTSLLGVGDWSGDGHSDVLARQTDGALRLYRGNGTGGWVSPYRIIGTGWNAIRLPGETTASSMRPQPTGVVYADHVAQWNVICGSDHYLADDPIVFPGAPGASHMHTFYGNTSTNAFTTLSSLSASSPSTCGRGMGTSDLSAYWVPSLVKKNADGTLSTYKGEQSATVYYKRPGEGRGPGVLPFPKGLRMIAGNAKATSDQSLSVIAWDCGRGGLESPHMYQCAGGSSQPMVANVIFPSCWDGVHLDSADHKSHMAYAASNGNCPSGHPVSLPEVSLEIEFVGLGGGPDYSLASGGIYSMHADFFADWDNQVQNALVVSCLNGARECADMNRDGSTLFRPDYDPEPITINLNNFSTASPWDGQHLQEPTPSSSPGTMTMSAHRH
jgi:hypothetical protein